MNGMVRPPNDGVHLETPQAQTAPVIYAVEGDFVTTVFMILDETEKTWMKFYDQRLLEIATDVDNGGVLKARYVDDCSLVSNLMSVPVPLVLYRYI